MFFDLITAGRINRKPKCITENLDPCGIEMSVQEWGSLKSECLVFMCPSGIRVCKYKGGLKNKNRVKIKIKGMRA